jgi:hypothetical protein
MHSLQNEHVKKLARTEKEIYYPHLYLEELQNKKKEQEVLERTNMPTFPT